MELTPEAVDRVVRAALAEDVGAGDRTTDAIVPVEARTRARIDVEEDGVVCGLEIAAAVFRALDGEFRFDQSLADGAAVERGACLADLDGSARAVLTGERTALNLLGRLSGIATLTRRYVDAVAGTGATILDTRKTTPGLRALEKYAVRCGGGTNHRAGLDDAILVKENHLRLAGGIAPAVAALRNGRPPEASLVDADQQRSAGSAGRPPEASLVDADQQRSAGSAGRPLEVEAETLAEVEEALAAGVDRILLDNMSPAEVGRAVELVAGRARLEASGGITLDNVRTYAETGVDFVSVGALTHSARSLHVSLEIL